MSRVLDADTLPISSTELLVLLVLASYADDEGGRCFPSQATIATRARLTDRTVRSAITRLVELGLVEVRGGGGVRSSDYRLVLEAGDFSTEFSTGADRASGGGRIVLPGGADRASGGGGSCFRRSSHRSCHGSKDQDQRRPEPPQRVLVRLAHEVLGAIEAGDVQVNEDTDELKRRAARARLAYDAGSVSRALDVAAAQRVAGKGRS